MTDAILFCLGLLLASADHTPDAPAWTWAVNLTGLACIFVVAWRSNREEDSDVQAKK